MSDNEKEVRRVGLNRIRKATESLDLSRRGTQDEIDERDVKEIKSWSRLKSPNPNQAVEGSVAAEPETLMWMVFEYTLGGSQPVVWNMKTREDAWECCPRDGRHFVARVLADSKEKG